VVLAACRDAADQLEEPRSPRPGFFFEAAARSAAIRTGVRTGKQPPGCHAGWLLWELSTLASVGLL